MVKERQKLDLFLFLWLVLTAVGNILSNIFHISYVATISYTAFILCWTLSLQKELPNRYIRRNLTLGGCMLILLFVARFLRYNFTETGSFADRFCWYLYYIPTTVIPFLSFSVSLHIGDRDRDRTRRRILPLRCVCGILCLLALTNDLHGLVLKIWVTDGELHSSPGIIFYFILAWSYILTIAAYIIMFRKCRISEIKRYWWIPPVWESIGLLLWILYYVNGASSPKIAGVSLYNLQEVYIILFLGLWESYIRIGFLPSASLIREKDWIRDRVLQTVNREMTEVKGILADMKTAEDPAFRERLIRLGCLGSYIKRRANMELISDERGVLNTTELSLAIRESFDYYSLAGVSVEYEESGNADLPALLVISAYELFQSVMEDSDCTACYVRVRSSQAEKKDDFRMLIETDARHKKASAHSVRDYTGAGDLMELFDADMNVTEYDETERLEVHVNIPRMRGPIGLLHLRWPFDREDPRGHYGMAGFLSLEQEALTEKILIHDNLGRSLLMTRRYLEYPDEVMRDALQEEWDRTLKEIDRKEFREDASVQKMTGKQRAGLGSERLAKNLGITVELTGELPTDDALRRIIDTACTVHITNVRKHTNGRRAMIRLEERESELSVTLTDDGEPFNGKIRETGGLKNLRSRVEAIGGRMTVTGEPAFQLKIELPTGKES